jgi:TadE-like protein
MIRRIARHLRRFVGREDASATLEFAIPFPAMLFILISSIELGMVTFNQTMLERAMDMTVRDIRLGTGNAPQYDEIKDSICTRAGFIKDCGTNLRLEMIQVDPRAWATLPGEPDCTDQSREVAPVRSFVNGQENELMILRACAKITPVFSGIGMGKNMAKDDAGQYRLISISAFVQEPR